MIDIEDIGDTLGSGAYKQAYASRSNKALAYLVTGFRGEAGKEQLENENRHLDTLSIIGVPTTKYLNIDFCEFDGRFCKTGSHVVGVMKRYAVGSKCGWKEYAKFVDILNNETIKDTRIILDGLTKHKKLVDDLQFLFGYDGHMVVSDPLDVRDVTDPKEYWCRAAVEYCDKYAYAAEYSMDMRARNAKFDPEDYFWECVDRFILNRKKRVVIDNRKQFKKNKFPKVNARKKKGLILRAA